jgi:hypothetical protein
LDITIGFVQTGFPAANLLLGFCDGNWWLGSELNLTGNLL